MLAGCPTVPGRQGTAPGSQDPPLIQNARRLLSTGSPDSLEEAARALSLPDAAGSPGTAGLLELGRELFSALYPEMKDNPFPADAAGGAYAPLFEAVRANTVVVPDPAETDFFKLIVPGLILLHPPEGMDDVTLSALEKAFAAADEKTGKISVLPPYLRGLSIYRRASSGTEGTGGVEAAEILALFQESIQRDPSFYPGIMAMADLYAVQGKYTDALTLLNDAAAILPDSASILKKISATALSAGKSQAALDASAKALLISPDDAEASMIRARAFEQQGSWYQAIRIIDTVLKRDPDMADAIRLQARLLADKAGNREEAVKLLTDAEARFPTDPAYPELLGRILLDAGRGNEGEAALVRALDLAPGRMNALELLLNYSMRTGRWLQAKSYLTRILELSGAGQYVAAGYTIAWNLGDYQAAADYARKLVSLGYGESPQYQLARALHALGNDAEALTMAEKGVADAKTPAVKSRFLYLRAAITGPSEPEKAVADLRMALLADSVNLDALLLISDLLAASKDFHAAVLYLKQAAALSSEDAGIKARIAELEKLSTPQKK